MAKGTERRGLGKGLGALIGGAESVADAPTGSEPTPLAAYAEIPLDRITPNPKQPRQVFDEEPLAELVHSIREVGLLQPIVVRPVGDGYEIVAGERRWRASREAGLERVPAIIRTTPDDELLRDALLENLHRVQLNALEEAAAYEQLLADFGGTQEELATRLGRSRPQVANTLRLLKLPVAVQRRVAVGVISAGHARALLSLDDPAAMERLAERIVAEGLSVRAVEELIIVGEADGRERKRKPRPRRKDETLEDAVTELVARLSDALETRVRIEMSKARGRIVIDVADMDDLHRIVEQIG